AAPREQLLYRMHRRGSGSGPTPHWGLPALVSTHYLRHIAYELLEQTRREAETQPAGHNSLGKWGMNVIFLSKRNGRARQLDLARPLTLTAIATLVLAFIGSAFALGIQLGRGNHERLVLADTTRFGTLLAEQKKQIADLRQQLQLRVDAMAMRLGEGNAHGIRPHALGKPLTA